MSKLSESFYRSLVESAPDAMIIVDQSGKVCVVNAQAEKMFGYSREQLLNQSIELLLPERVRESHQALRQTYIADPRLRSLGSAQELYGRRNNGSEFPVEISLSPLQTTDGLFVCSIIRDITDRREIDKTLSDAKIEAERANKANSAFLAAASHDLRQPVQALSLLSGALRRTVTDPKALEMLEIQGQSLSALTNLLNSLLDISRLDGGGVTPDFEEFRINDLTDHLSTEFSRQAMQKGLSFTSTPCDAIVRSDWNLLTEIVRNLVSNAIRYTNDGCVTLDCQIHDGNIQLAVIDTGIGIESDQLGKIFDEFHQCKSRGAANEGFGLGLAIVNRLADLLEHEISVSSEPGNGSSFAVSVPFVGITPSSLHEEHLRVNAADAKPGGASVLLVEDDLKVAESLRLLFESAGYEIGIASSKLEAIATLNDVGGAPDVIVSDYHLIGESTGVDTIVALRELADTMIPAIIVTGDTSKLVNDACDVKNCAILNKPVDPDELIRMATNAISTGVVPS